MEPLEDVGTIIFCDETKFNKNDQDYEDAIYYFGISLSKTQVHKVSNEFKSILEKRKIKAETFHSSKIFKKNRLRSELMNDIISLITKNRLNVFCVKYEKSWMYEPTKMLNQFNNDLLDFNNSEFQALFYFLTTLNLFISENQQLNLEKKIVTYFDRNVYGKHSTEVLQFPNKQFVFENMTFCDKSKINLLALADFIGFIFRKSKISQNNFDFGNKSIESNPLNVSAYYNMFLLNQSKLFYFIENDEDKIRKSLEAILENND